MKHNIGALASSIDADSKRSSNSWSSGPGTIMAGFNISASTALSSAIAAMIHGEGVAFSLVESPLLARVVKAARHAPADYRPPTAKEIGGVYLDK